MREILIIMKEIGNEEFEIKKFDDRIFEENPLGIGEKKELKIEKEGKGEKERKENGRSADGGENGRELKEGNGAKRFGLKSLFLYSSVFFAGIFFGFYLFFPWNSILTVINSSFEFVEIEKAGFNFPWGVNFRGVTIYLPEIGRVSRSREELPKIHLSYLKIIPGISLPFAFISGSPLPFSLELETNERTSFSAVDIKIDRENFFPREIRTEGVLDVKDILPIFNIRGSGKLKISSYIKIGKGGIKTLSGNIRVFSDKLVVELRNTGNLNIPVEGEFSLGSVEFISSINEGVVTINRLVMRGGDISGDISGTVKLNTPFEQSELNLTLMLETKVFQIPLQKFKIVGTLKEPKFQGI